MEANVLFFMAYVEFDRRAERPKGDFYKKDIREYREILLDLCAKHPGSEDAAMLKRGAATVPLATWSEVMVMSRKTLQSIKDELANTQTAPSWGGLND